MARRSSKFSKKMLKTRGGFIPPSMIRQAQAKAYQYATGNMKVPSWIATPAIGWAGQTAYNLGKKYAPKFALPASIGDAAKKAFQSGYSPASLLKAHTFTAATTKPTKSYFQYGHKLSSKSLVVQDDYTRTVLNRISSASIASASAAQASAIYPHGTFPILQSYFETMQLTGPTPATSTQNIMPQSTKLFVGGYSGFIDIRSSTNNTVNVLIRDVACKRDVQDTNGTDPVSLNPINAWGSISSQDFNSVFPAGYTNMTQNTVGSRPTDSDMFNCYYQILAVQLVELLPGATHTHGFDINVNKTVHNLLLGNGEITQANYRDYSFFTMITIYGDVVHGTANSDNINYGPSAVDTMQREKNTIYYIPFSANIELTQGLAGVNDPETFVDTNIQDASIQTD